jgi:uncharacterized protein YeeX (DUF496 family)
MENEYQETFGARIRQFFRELFGSRLVERLEEDLMRLRQDFEDRTQEHKIIVASLREEKQMLLSKIATYEAVIMPHTSRVGAEVVAYQAPKKPAFNFVDMPREKTRWEQVQEDHEKQLALESAEEEKKKAASAASKE